MIERIRGRRCQGMLKEMAGSRKESTREEGTCYGVGVYGGCTVEAGRKRGT